MADSERRHGIQSVGIGLRVLDVLAAQDGAQPLGVIAAAADLSSSQAHRYLASLVTAGMARQDPASGRYDLGPAALRLGLGALIPRENYEAGYTLCTMQAESRGMLKDRVTGLTRTQMYAPRYYRRFPTAPRIVAEGEGFVQVRHNLLLVQTLIDKTSDIVLSAVCHDKVVVDEGRLRFAERIVVFDSEMIPNSLVYPA